jgi:hypothetical protein
MGFGQFDLYAIFKREIRVDDILGGPRDSLSVPNGCGFIPFFPYGYCWGMVKTAWAGVSGIAGCWNL